MFQNIEDVHENNQYQEESSKKVNIFSNIFSKNKIILYIIVFMISTLGIGQDVSVFSLAIVAACIAGGVPILGVAIIGLVGNSIAFGITGALNYMVTLLVLIITLFIIKPRYNEDQRNEKVRIAFNVFISMILVQAVKLAVSGFTLYDALLAITLSIIAVVFYKIFVNSIVVVEEFTERNAFSIEEVIGASLMLAIAVSAIGDFEVMGFSIRNILSILIVLVLGWKNGILIGTTSGVAIGVTLGVIAGTEPVMIAAYAISGMIAGILNKFGKIGVIVGFIVGNGVLAYISNGWTADLIIFKEILIASIGLLAMPKNIKINIEEFMGKSNLLPTNPTGALNATKEKEVADKLNSVSSAIQDIADTYKEDTKSESKEKISEENKNIFISELLNELDGKQDNMLYDDMVSKESKIPDELFTILVDKQHIDREDLLRTFAKFNNYIVGFDDKEISAYLEKNIEIIVNAVNSAYNTAKVNFIYQKKLKENKKNISTQLDGVSKAISGIAEDMKQDLKNESKFSDKKIEIIELLKQSNINLEDVSIKREKNGRYLIEVFVQSKVQEIKEINTIEKVLSNVLKDKIVLGDKKEGTLLTFISEDKYILNLGMATNIKKGNTISGDNNIKVRLKDGKYLIAISDGMGSGEKANKSSKLALNMLKKLLSSGFEKDTSIELINTTILNTTDENFATLDIAIVDLYAGNIEFIKTGACPTYIKNKKRVDLIKTISLPTGVIGNAKLTVYDRDIESGEIMIMCSDGIIDSNVEYKNKELWIKYMFEDIETDDSQKIADLLINEAIDNNYGIAKDDMTLIVCKFIKKNK